MSTSKTISIELEFNLQHVPTPTTSMHEIEKPPGPFSKDMLMPAYWHDKDLLVEHIFTMRFWSFDATEMNEIKQKASRFLLCMKSGCSCDGWRPGGIMPRGDRRQHSLCNNSQCGHLMDNHGKKIEYSDVPFLGRYAYDIINIKGTLNNETIKEEKNTALIRVLNSIYPKFLNKIRTHNFKSLDVVEVCGSPPFEKRNIQQILFNFCTYKFGDKKSELEEAFMITKFIIRYFDTWIWITPEKISKDILQGCDIKKSYEFYYERHLIFCCLPVCLQTIQKRYRTTIIFGKDVLRYTFKSFRTQLQDWCKAESVSWTERTKFICLDRLPLYMDLLENEVYDFRSPIWRFDYKEADFIKKFTQWYLI